MYMRLVWLKTGPIEPRWCWGVLHFRCDQSDDGFERETPIRSDFAPKERHAGAATSRVGVETETKGW